MKNEYTIKKTNVPDNLAKPALVASDIGGTLIRGGNIVPDFTAMVLNRLIIDGVPTALITGFNYKTTLKYTRNLDPRVMLLPQNGSLCLRNGELMWEYRIPPLEAGEIYRYLVDIGLPVIIYKGRNQRFANFYVYQDEIESLAYSFTRVDQLEDKEDITGISTLLPDLNVVEVKEHIEWILGDAFKVIYVREQRHSWLEVVHRDVRKDLALERLCAELQISLGDVIYFGDNFNDCEVLRRVGRPVLVDNAMPEMKREFKTVIGSVSDEGVAKYLDALYYG